MCIIVYIYNLVQEQNPTITMILILFKEKICARRNTNDKFNPEKNNIFILWEAISLNLDAKSASKQFRLNAAKLKSKIKQIKTRKSLNH